MNARLRREAAGAHEAGVAEPPFSPPQHASGDTPRPRRSRKRRRGRASESVKAAVVEAEAAAVLEAAPVIEAAPAAEAAPGDEGLEIEVTVADPSFEAPPAVTVSLTPSEEPAAPAIEVLVAPESPISTTSWLLEDDARVIDAMPVRAAAAPDPEPGESLGAYLRRFRLARRISLDEVAASTRIPVRSLNLLEADDFAALPAEVFVKGFIRCYTRAVGLDLPVAMGLYEGSRQVAEPIVLPTAPVADEASRRRVSLALVTLIVVILATLTLSILFARPRSSHLERAELQAPPPAATSPTATDLGAA